MKRFRLICSDHENRQISFRTDDVGAAGDLLKAFFGPLWFDVKVTAFVDTGYNLYYPYIAMYDKASGKHAMIFTNC